MHDNSKERCWAVLSCPTTPNVSFVPWSLKRSATMLDQFAQLFQHCWGHARSLRMDYKDLWVVFFPRCTAGPNIVGSCCIRLHTTANTHATTPNIVGATMLVVNAPVCTQPKSPYSEHIRRMHFIITSGYSVLRFVRSTKQARLGPWQPLLQNVNR